MVTFVVTEPGPLHAAANDAAPVIDFVERDLTVTEISPAEAGDPSAADKPDWIAVQLPTGEKGFLHRAAVKPLQAAPEEIDQNVFFTQLRFEVASPFGRADHHYLFALAAAESGIKNLPASPGSDAIGPFKYSTDRWAELVAEYGALPPPITTTDRSDLAKQIEMAAREAHGDADKIEQLVGRPAQYNELYLIHQVGLAAGQTLLAISKDHAEMAVEEALRQGGMTAEDAAKLVQGHPILNGSLAEILDAAANALTQGFNQAAELALRLDPPELQAAAAPSQAGSVAPRDARDIRQFEGVARQVVDFFTQKTEWSKTQAIGIIANIYAESKFNPNIPGDGGAAYGLCQWHSDRQKFFTQQFRKSIKNSTFEEQLQFIDFELHNNEARGAGESLRPETTPEAAASVISLKYERPAGKETEAAARARIATAFAQLLA
jgi:hypothetical protein